MHSIEQIEKWFRRAVIPVALISAYFTFEFARSTMANPFMGVLLGGALAICAFCSAYIWTIRQFAKKHGASKMQLAFMLGCGLIFTGTDAFTNAGSLLWQRSAADTTASVQNVKYEDTRKAVEDAEARITFFETRIADLKGGNPWITSVSADGLKGQIPALQEAVRQEERRGGCGPKCLGLQKELAGIQERIALAEQLGSHEKMLAAAHTGLAKAREIASGSTAVVSATSSQALSLATLGTLSLKPSDEAQEWTGIIVGAALAIFLTFAPMAMEYVGSGVWRASGVPKAEAPKETVSRFSPVNAVPQVIRETIVEKGGQRASYLCAA